MPWNPGIQDQSGQLLAAGIGGGIDALTQAVEKKKKENDNAKYTEALFKNNPELQGAAGIDYETLRGMSARDKIQTGMAAITKVQMQQMAQKNAAEAQLRGAQAKQYLDADQREQAAPLMAARMDQLMAGSQDPNAVRSWMEDSGPGAPMPAGQPPLDGLRAYLKAGAETGAVTGSELKSMLGDYSREQIAQTREEARRKADLNPREFTSKSGKNFVLFGNSIVPGDARAEPTQAGTEDWLYSDNADEFRKGISSISDPKVRDATLKTRVQYLKAMGKTDLLTELLKGVGGNAPATSSAKPAASNRKKYNPTTGKFE